MATTDSTPDGPVFTTEAYAAVEKTWRRARRS